MIYSGICIAGDDSSHVLVFLSWSIHLDLDHLLCLLLGLAVALFALSVLDLEIEMTLAPVAVCVAAVAVELYSLFSKRRPGGTAETIWRTPNRASKVLKACE